ncbi:MAG: ABC transporter ATP-binding protein [Herpetosiphonaceae bacterium]|nr:MAG: ABC transporter ATP-binding protein [Herpetosiphonaceae bacterium]
MADVGLQHISKRFGQNLALDDVSFEIKDGEFFVLLGPTGAGKTTTLRIIAGLERQDQGVVTIDDEPADHLPPAERDVAFVFQQYSLYPTMTVYDNLAFPLRSPLRRIPEAEIKQRVEETAEKLRISHLLQRKTAHLSGGEMQRVSIGRAIVRHPRIFLMDEPLSNLDAKLREALRIELSHLQKTQGSTTLFVTHDQTEALTMADRIAVLDQGRIVQIGSPYDIYDRPATTFVAQMVGSPKINLLPAARENGNLHITDSPITLPADASVELPAALVVGVRPEDVVIEDSGQFSGQVMLIEPLGMETVIYLKSGGQTLVSTTPGITRLRIGNEARFSIARQRIHYFGSDGVRI